MTGNPNEELVKAISMLEEIKGMATTQQQINLADAVHKTEILFAKALCDFLTTIPGGLTPAEISYARDGQRLPAIKLIKQRLGCGINEAKEVLEKWQKENGINPCGGQR